MKFEIIKGKLVATGKWAKSRNAAIRNSIKGWRVMAKYLEQPIPDKGADRTCNLCQLYDGCIGCPIFEKTGKKQCEGTAYYKFTEARWAGDHPKALEAAWDMVDLLEELLD